MAKNMTRKKKILKIVLLSSFALIILGLLVCGTYISSIFIKTKDVKLKSEPQIQADSAAFDADISYASTNLTISKKYSRLGYNQNAPIKAVLKDNLQERTKRIITKAYTDVINPIMAQINDKYYFETVNEKDFKKTNADKVVIRFESGKEPSGLELIFAPLATTHYDLSSSFNPVLTNFKIKINEFFFDEETPDERILHVIVHEILHTFGLSDVYEVENYGTMLKADVNNELLKPNDIKMLAALYFDDYDSLESLQEWILIYTDNYYKEYSKLFLDAEIDDYEVYEPDSYEDLAVENGSIFIKKGSIKIMDINAFDSLNLTGISQTYGLSYQIKLQNGVFNYLLTDINMQQVLEEKSGRYYFYNGKIFLGVFDIRSYDYLYRVELVIVNSENGLELACIEMQLMRLHYTEQILMQEI